LAMPLAPRSPRLAPAACPSVAAEGAPTKRKGKRERTETPETREEATEQLGIPHVTADPTTAKRSGKKARAQEAEMRESAPKVETAEEGEHLSADAFRAKFEITSVRDDLTLPEPVQSFQQAPFSKAVRKALQAVFPAPSPIQAQGWPIAAEGRDLVAVAKTGSGKTLCFLLPAFKLVVDSAAEMEEPLSTPAPLVLVLAPTRELATQIEAECVKFSKIAKVSSLAVFGGAPKPPQVKALAANPQVLVATPGRLQDLMEMKAVCLSQVAFLVLDEGDRMLDMGFEPEIAKILAETRADRQTLLFTATWPKAVKKIAAKYLKADFVHVNVGKTDELAANTAVCQEFLKKGDDEKEDALWRILADLPDDAKLICFANTKRRIEGLQKVFWEKGFESAALHGDRAQWERDRDLEAFTTGKTWLLFATDVCARGLDIKEVTHVVNFDMARDVESYIHRIGRTGRAGAKGTSITFWNEDYDTECAPALVKIAKEAGQQVPEWLDRAATKQTQVKNKLWRY